MLIQDQDQDQDHRSIYPLSDPSLQLPRLLCLHGGGTNAHIFHSQTRVLRAQLSPYFRLCFADAPFICHSPGPDVTAVYQHLAPFRRWLRWLDVHPEVSAETAIVMIEAAIERAMAEDDERGATGEWVGIVGFSQGAKVAGSLLLRQQQQRQQERIGKARGRGRLERVTFRFAVLMAGRAPLVSLQRHGAGVVVPGLQDAGQTGMDDVPPWKRGWEAPMLQLPTIHVHGLRDPGLEGHRQLLKEYCEAYSASLVEWDGSHRVPIKKGDVVAIRNQILDVAIMTGVFGD